MMYQRPTFTCPTVTANVTQQQYDLAVLSKAEYMRKYQITAAAYDKLTRGE
jgi:hypothetical protein